MPWYENAEQWLREEAAIPNGERSTRLAAFASEIAGVSPAMFQKYVRAYHFLEQARQAASALNPSDADANHAILNGLSPSDLDHLRQIRRYGETTFYAVLEKVFGGLRGEALRGAWRVMRADFGAQAVQGTPPNLNQLRTSNSALRTMALTAASRSVGLEPNEVSILENATTIAPFSADAIAIPGERRPTYVGFRHLGDTGRPGLRPRVNDAIASGLAAARGFDTFYIVAHAAADVDVLVKGIWNLGRCGLGVVRFETWTRTSIIALDPQPRRASRGPDLKRRLESTLFRERLLRGRTPV